MSLSVATSTTITGCAAVRVQDRMEEDDVLNFAMGESCFFPEILVEKWIKRNRSVGHRDP